jgi:hypothetical protein
MALELGLNPNKLGKISNNRQEPWKQPLPQFIEHLYLKRFGRARPERVVRIEERVSSGKKRPQGAALPHENKLFEIQHRPTAARASSMAMSDHEAGLKCFTRLLRDRHPR